MKKTSALSLRLATGLLATGLLVTGLLACSEDKTESSAQTSAPTATTGTATSEASTPEGTYSLELFIPGSAFHGIHGLTVTRSGRLLAGSVVGQSIYEIDRETGAVSLYEGPPHGMADDLEEGPDGELGWTAFLEGKYYLRTREGELRTLARGLPGLNSTAWNAQGRLFATQVFLGDALYELDPSGEKPPRKIMEGMGGLNGFDFGPDGKLYGPLWFKGQIARVDVDTAKLEVVAEGFTVPAAVNFDSKGNLWAVDTALGHVYRVNLDTGEKTLVAETAASIDNLAFDADDRLFISNMADNAIIEIDTATGAQRTLTRGDLAIAADLDMAEIDGREMLVIGDLFALKKADLDTGDVSDIGRVFGSTVDYPIGVAFANGRIGVAGWSSGAVQLFDSRTLTPGKVHHNFSAPVDALPLKNGKILIASHTDGTIMEVSPDWKERRELASGLAGLSSLVLGKEGLVYISEYAAGQISTLNPETGAITQVVEGLDGPEGFAFAPDGTLVVAETLARRLTRIDLATGEKTILADNLPIGMKGPQSAPPLYIPTGVAVARNGDIYIASDMQAAVYRLRKN